MPPSHKTLLIGAAFLTITSLAGGFAYFALSAEVEGSKESLEQSSQRVRRLQKHLAEARLQVAQAGTQLIRTQRKLKTVKNRLRNSQHCPPGPHVTVFPGRGAVGTRVTLVGDCFVGEPWKHLRSNMGYGISLVGEIGSDGSVGAENVGSRENPLACELVASAPEGDFRILRTGHMKGYFIVPSQGSCFQERKRLAVMPGRYIVILGCRSCGVASFWVTDQ